MLGIKIGDVFLQLQSGTTAEMEKNSPLFVADAILGEYSTPFTIPYTESNDQALVKLYNFITGRSKTTFTDAELYDGNTFLDRGTFVIEGANLNLNNIRNTMLTGYFLTGISGFFTLIREKKLKELSLGGTRNFAYTTADPTDGSGGFWQHIHDTWNFTSDYVFQPCRNEDYSDAADWMNKLDAATGKINFDLFNPLVPFIKLKYLFEQCLEEHGYTVDWSGIDDTDWEKLLLASATPINWSYVNLGGSGVYSFVGISLNEHVDQTKTISSFMLEVCKYYGWYPSISKRKVCKMVALRTVPFSTETKDWTPYVQPVMPTTFAEDAKVYSYTTDFGNDSYPSEPDFTGYTFGTPVLLFSNLPTPDTALDHKLFLVLAENRWYELIDDGGLVWSPFADNIFNNEVTDSNETINCAVAAVPSVFALYRSSGGTDYYGYFPVVQCAARTDLGFRTLFFHGMVTEEQEGGTLGSVDYPLASSSAFNPSGSGDLAWSNVFVQDNNGTEMGVVEYWHKTFADVFRETEDIDMRFNLPLHILAAFDFKDVILVRNIPFLITRYLKPIPYKGVIQATLKRIYYTGFQGSTAAAALYVRLEIDNITTGGSASYPDTIWGGAYNYTNIEQGEVLAKFYSDVAGTIPVSVVNVDVIFKLSTTKDAVAHGDVNSTRTANGVSVNWSPFYLIDPNTRLEYDIAYTGTNPFPITGPGHYEHTIEIVPDAAYTVLP